MRRTNFWTGLAGVLVGALMVSALPAIAQVAETNAVPGSNFKLGQTNIVNANTALRGNSGTNLVLRNTGNGVPLNLLTNGNGKPPMVVDSRKVVKNLNADRLDFRHANELIRAEYGSMNDASDANGAAVTATVTAPKPGILIMSGSIDASGSTDDWYSCNLTVNGTFVTGTGRVARVNNEGGDHTDNSEEDCATDGGWAVDAGTHNVALHIGDRNTALLLGASVWVIWVPFDGNGNVPSP